MKKRIKHNQLRIIIAKTCFCFLFGYMIGSLVDSFWLDMTFYVIAFIISMILVSSICRLKGQREDIRDSIFAFEYFPEWFEKEWNYQKIGAGYWQINVPFLNPDHDYLQFYIKKKKNRIVLTDDGFLLHNSQINEEIKVILQTYGIRLKNNSLVLAAPKEKIHEKMRDYIQCLIIVSHLQSGV